MFGLLLIALLSGILAIAVLSVEDFQLTVASREKPAITWEE